MLEWIINPLVDNFIWPKKSDDGSAAFDLFYHGENYQILPGKIYSIPLSFQSKFKSDFCVQLLIRSGVASVEDMTLVNSIGLIDSSYRGEWKAIIRKNSGLPFMIEHGMRIFQCLFIPVPKVYMRGVQPQDNFYAGDRLGGIGHTGLK